MQPFNTAPKKLNTGKPLDRQSGLVIYTIRETTSQSPPLSLDLLSRVSKCKGRTLLRARRNELTPYRDSICKLKYNCSISAVKIRIKNITLVAKITTHSAKYYPAKASILKSKEKTTKVKNNTVHNTNFSTLT
jgi:hypothetical protein